MFSLFLFVFSNVLFVYSNSLNYLDVKKNFSLEVPAFGEKSYFINPLNPVVAANFSDDTFNYENLKENEKLNLEKEINTSWGKKLFRFSAISIGSFPLTFFLSLFLYDVSYYFIKNMDPRYTPFSFSNKALTSTEFMYKIIVSLSLGALISFTIALIDYFL